MIDKQKLQDEIKAYNKIVDGEEWGTYKEFFEKEFKDLHKDMYANGILLNLILKSIKKAELKGYSLGLEQGRKEKIAEIYKQANPEIDLLKTAENNFKAGQEAEVEKKFLKLRGWKNWEEYDKIGQATELEKNVRNELIDISIEVGQKAQIEDEIKFLEDLKKMPFAKLPYEQNIDAVKVINSRIAKLKELGR